MTFDLSPCPHVPLSPCSLVPLVPFGGMDAREYVSRMRRGEFPELEIEARKQQSV
ncbi:MAG: hypothetical protein F6J93_19815 [Oscillatoria sp. SIO1A7]|nr:hypothetical protein [Oscillatoria sp. SIO1A7]